MEESEVGEAMTTLGSRWKDEYVLSNPEAAYLAWLYGDMTPTKEQREYLNRKFAGQEP